MTAPTRRLIIQIDDARSKSHVTHVLRYMANRVDEDLITKKAGIISIAGKKVGVYTVKEVPKSESI